MGQFCTPIHKLANVIERGAIVSQSDKLQVEFQSQVAPGALPNSTLLTEAEVEQMRRTNIIACMKEAGGRVSGENGAAALLGIKPTTLYSRLKKMGLKGDDW